MEFVCMSVCLFAAIYRKFQMSEFKYSMKTERRFMHASVKAAARAQHWCEGCPRNEDDSS